MHTTTLSSTTLAAMRLYLMPPDLRLSKKPGPTWSPMQ